MKWIDRTLIQLPMFVCVCFSEKELHTELTKLKIPKEQWPAFISPGSDATVHEFTHNHKTATAIVCIRKNKQHSLAQVVGLLAHEATHVWQWIRDNMGEKEPSPEFEAYAIQHLVQQCVCAYYGGKKK